jgi:hypothetical protein
MTFARILALAALAGLPASAAAAQQRYFLTKEAAAAAVPYPDDCQRERMCMPIVGEAPALPPGASLYTANGWAHCLDPATEAPVACETPGRGLGGVGLLPRPAAADPPAWRQLPGAARFQANYPAGAQGPGHAVVSCQAAADGGLTACRVLEESPPGQGFGAAGLTLATLVRIAPGSQAPGAVIELPMVWTAPAPP